MLPFSLALTLSHLELITDFVTEVLVLGLYPGLQNNEAFQGVFQVPGSNLGLETKSSRPRFLPDFSDNSEV